jgi:hypothetical protein
MRVPANAPASTVALPPPAKTQTHQGVFWFLFFDLITMCLVLLGLCKIAFFVWPVHPMIALILGMGIWILASIKAKSFLEWRRRNISKLALFLSSWVGFSSLMIIFDTQFRSPFDEFGIDWIVGWIAGGLLFAGLMHLWTRSHDALSA